MITLECQLRTTKEVITNMVILHEAANLGSHCHGICFTCPVLHMRSALFRQLKNSAPSSVHIGTKCSLARKPVQDGMKRAPAKKLLQSVGQLHQNASSLQDLTGCLEPKAGQTVCLVLHSTQITMNQAPIKGRQYTINLNAKRLSCSSNAWSGLDHYKGSRVIIYPDAIGSVILCHSTACWHQDHLQDRSGASAYRI